MIDVLIVTFLVVAAAKAVLDAWLEGSIFATARAYAEAWKESDRRVVRLFGELLSCRFCLGYHVSFILSVMFCCLLPSWVLIAVVALAARGIEHEVNRYVERIYNDPQK
jgi:hypothetical protein